MFPLWLVLVSLLVYILYRSTRKPDRFPPGPPRWPLVGGAPHLVSPGSLFHGVRAAIASYGPVVGVYLGRTPAILVADFEILRELFKKEETASRPPLRPINETRMGHELPELEGRIPGVLFSTGRNWRDQRRFVLRHLRDFGFGKASMEGMIHAEVEKLSKMYHDNTGKPYGLIGGINVSIINALWTILVGDSLELDDPNLKRIVDVLEKTIMTFNPFSPVAMVLPHPSLAKLPVIRNYTGYQGAKDMFGQLNAFIAPYIKEHRQTFQRDNIRDLMDLIIQENQDTTDEESPYYGEKGVAALFNTFIELFQAGMGGTSASLIWSFLYMIKNLEVQKKVHEELDRVCGRDRLPSLSDQDNLPYTNAVLHESFRITGFSFLAVPHYTTDSVDCNGFSIPKGSIVFGCLHAIMNDPKNFADPDVFRPERFIKSGKFVPDERVIPFSIGKRACLGQTLAEKEFYLFFAGIMQSFEIRPAPGVALPEYTSASTLAQGVQRIPPNFKVVLTSRM